VHRPLHEEGEDRRSHVAAPAAPATRLTPAPAAPAHVAPARKSGETREAGHARPGAAERRRWRRERAVGLRLCEVFLRPEGLLRVGEGVPPAVVVMVFSWSK
jgi:hypothetical protein